MSVEAAEEAWEISEVEKTASAPEAGEKRFFLEEPVRNIAYYLAFALCCIVSFLDRTEFEGVLGIPMADFESMVQAAMLLLLLFKTVFQRAGALQWAIAVAVVAVGFVSWRQSYEGWLFWLALFVVCGQGIRLKPLAAISLFVTACLFALTVACAQLGLVGDLVFGRQGVAVRHAMGFSHPNSFGLYLLMICLSFSVLRFGKNPAPDILLLGIAAAANLAVADSRTSAFLCVAQAILLVIFHVVRGARARKVLSWAFLGGVALVVIVSFYFMLFYDATSPVQSELNSLLSGRLHLAHAYYEMGGVTLFGNDYSGYETIYWERGKAYTFVVDNAYCHLLLRYGLIPTALFLAGYALLLVRVVRNRRWDSLLFGLVLMAAYGFAETLGVRIESNFFLVAMASLVLYRGKAESSNEASAFSRDAGPGFDAVAPSGGKAAVRPSGRA